MCCKLYALRAVPDDAVFIGKLHAFGRYVLLIFNGILMKKEKNIEIF